MNENNFHYNPLASNITLWGNELGFLQVGITKPSPNEPVISHFDNWLQNKMYGEMEFLPKHRTPRVNPELLLPEVKSIICCSLNYYNEGKASLDTPANILNSHIATYAQGHDYHQIMRQRLKLLAQKIATSLPKKEQQNFRFRVFCDSAPVFEKSFAEQAGLGFVGKNTLLINPKFGSYCFLGEIYTNLSIEEWLPEPFLAQISKTSPKSLSKNIVEWLPETFLEISHKSPSHTPSLCGSCNKCLTACPTKALIAPKTLNAKSCIAYLTIEHKGSIPEELRKMIGSKIYGCDLCQQCCPYNRFAKVTEEPLLTTHSHLNDLPLSELFSWDEATYLANTAKSPLARLGHERWLRNIAVALGNSQATKKNLAALQSRINHPSPLVQEHVRWALEQYMSISI